MARLELNYCYFLIKIRNAFLYLFDLGEAIQKRREKQ